MDVFDLRNRLVDDYARYTRSFIEIADPRILNKVDGALDDGALWPEPLLQLNPTFLPGGTIDDLVSDGTLHPECQKIFRIDKTDADPVGKQLLPHTHQTEAIRKAKEGKSYVLTSGTGSGKSLTYIVPIVDHVLRRGSGQGIQGIVVYPVQKIVDDTRVSTVLYTDFHPEGKIAHPTAADLAKHAIQSVKVAEEGKDGISYLINAIASGIRTLLTPDYETEILRQTGTRSLEEALQKAMTL